MLARLASPRGRVLAGVRPVNDQPAETWISDPRTGCKVRDADSGAAVVSWSGPRVGNWVNGCLRQGGTVASAFVAYESCK